MDQTGVGEVFMEEAHKAGLKNARGVILTLPSKQDIMMYLKQVMGDERLWLPYYSQLFNELNVERYELLKTGRTQFSHPDGTHDDMLWALALAVYAARPEIPNYKPVIAFGHAIKPPWSIPRTENPKPGTPSVTYTVPCLTCWSAKGPDGKCPQGHQG